MRINYSKSKKIEKINTQSIINLLGKNHTSMNLSIIYAFMILWSYLYYMKDEQPTFISNKITMNSKIKIDSEFYSGTKYIPTNDTFDNFMRIIYIIRLWILSGLYICLGAIIIFVIGIQALLVNMIEADNIDNVMVYMFNFIARINNR
jgi:hypothetical protein